MRGDTPDLLTDVDQTIPAARHELADLTAALRSDLTELAGLASKAEPRRGRRS